MPLFGSASPQTVRVGTIVPQQVLTLDPFTQIYSTFLLGGGSATTMATGGADIFSAANRACIITHVSYDSSSALSANLSLRDRVYFYVFGEKPGLVTIKGVCMSGPPCVPEGWTSVYNGFDLTLEYYEIFRISSLAPPIAFYTRNGTRSGGFLSGPRIFGFPVKYHYETAEPSTNMGAFAITLITIPRIHPSVAIWW